MSYKEIGTWVRDNTEEDAKIACVEIGHVGWYSGRYIIDILGLVTPHNAKLVGERKLDEWLKYYHPDYLLVHDPLWPHESSVQSLEDKRLFLPMENFDFPGFRLLKKNQQS